MPFRPLSLTSICLIATVATADPAYREDQRLWLSSIESKTLSLQEDLQELRVDQLRERESVIQQAEAKIADLREKQANAGRLGFPIINDSKQDYEQLIRKERMDLVADLEKLKLDQDAEMTEKAEALVNILATTPSTEDKSLKDTVRTGTASHENIEIYNALKNLQATIELLNAELAENPHDLQLAIDVYGKQRALYSTVKVLTIGFSNRIDSVYRPRLNELLDRIDLQIQKTANSDVDRTLAKSEIGKLKAQRKALKQNRPRLSSMQKWANAQARELDGQLRTLQLMKENAELAADTSAFAADINATFTKLRIAPPTIIEYDLIESDLLITDPDTPR